MTNETRELIKYYKEQLPHMKEKLAAAIMMLVVAACVTITATYAWTTLSTAPEVSNVETTVAANGSLEIALAKGNGELPGKSAEGDSTGAGTAVSIANTTWGNLINLSDDNVYGLSKVTLRPAALNTAGLLTSPLYGVEYGEDGRISNRIYDENFAFSYYDGERFRADVEENKHLGVRAITTVQYENTQGASQFKQYSEAAKGAYQDAGAAYKIVTGNTRYIGSLQELIQKYAQSIINGTDTKDIGVKDSMVPFYDMVNDLLNEVMIPMGKSYVYMANLWDLITPDAQGTTGYKNIEELITAYDSGTIPVYVTENIESLDAYISDYKKFKEVLNTDIDYDVEYSKTKSYNLAYCKYRAEKNEEVYWTNIEGIVDWLCQISTATLDGYKMTQLSSASNAASVLTHGEPHQAVLHEGAIFRLDRRLSSSDSMLMTITVSVNISSMMDRFNSTIQGLVNLMYPGGNVTFKNVQLMSAANKSYEKYDKNTVYYLPTEVAAVSSKNPDKFEGGEATAEDTYAMAIDLWVRTNAGSDGTAINPEEVTESIVDGKKVETIVTKTNEQAYLTLEGKTETVSYEVAETMKDAGGNDQPKYLASYELEDPQTGQKVTSSVDVFKLSDGKYYYVEKGQNVCLEDVLTAEGISGVEITYTPKTQTVVEVNGYSGVNRVWDESTLANEKYKIGEDEIRTTQGGGSCYIFYAETPADQSRFLKLLEAMKVVFVDSAGNQIGVASMDTEHYYADTGKVTVPLILDPGQSINLGEDSTENAQYALMPLRKNAATRITAIVYLDGTKLTNDMVLASGDIQGSLNIQFGSSVALQKTTITKEDDVITDTKVEYESGQDSEAIKNETVMKESLKVSASVTQDKFTFGTSSNGKYTTTLNVNVTGVEPNSVEARFIRAISSTQGVQQSKEILTSVGDSRENWSVDYTFTRPGSYVLRSVWIDGVEYSLAEPVNVVVEGNSVSGLTWNQMSEGNKKAVFSSENSYKVEYALELSKSGSLPKRVNGIILDSAGQQISVPFHYDTQAEDWIGSATFTTSSTYTIKYVEVDGDYYELTEAMQKELELHLGLKVRTWISASAETLAKLKEMNASFTPTNFGLIDDVTLQVSAEVYDNNDIEITSLSGAVLNYQREGTTGADGRLDTNLKWDGMTGKYEGEFLVNIAGNYAFSNVTFAGSPITKCTDDTPTITCISMKETYYVESSTKPYQYAPDKPAVFEVQIANSGTASIIAELTNTTTGQSISVSGKDHTRRTADVPDGEGNQIITWEIDVATDDDASQEGEWKLTDLKIYGAIYDGVFCTKDNPGTMIKTVNGVTTVGSDTIPVTISTDVVKFLHVTLKGSDRISQKEFMAAVDVTDMTVTVADYAGRPMEGLDISSVEVVYDLVESEVGLSSSKYAYKVADGEDYSLSDVTVTGKGKLKSGSATEYIISGLTFNHAGPYKFSAANVVATVNGKNVRTEMFYETVTSTETINNRAPEIDVELVKPTVTITGTDKAGATKENITGGELFTDYVDGKWIQTMNYYEPYYANVHTSASDVIIIGTTYTSPTVTMELTDAGNEISSTNKVTFGYEYGNNSNSVTFTGTGKNGRKDLKVGTASVGNRESLGKAVTEDTIEMVYKGATFTVKLSNPVTIRQVDEPALSITYTIPGLYADILSKPASVIYYNGKGKAVLPELNVEKIVTVSTGNGTTGEETEIVSQEIEWTTIEEKGGCSSGTEEVKHTGRRETTTTYYTATGETIDVLRKFSVSQWKEGDKTYIAGTEQEFSAGNHTVTAEVVTKDLETVSEQPTVTTVRTGQKGEPVVVYYDEKGNPIDEPDGWK